MVKAVKEYEVIREIPNSCSNNQMRDISFAEVKTDSPENYVRGLFPDKDVAVDTDVHSDGSITIYARVSDTIHKYMFTEI